MTDNTNNNTHNDSGPQAFADSFAAILYEARRHVTVMYGFADLLRKEIAGPLNDEQQELVAALQKHSALLKHFMDQSVTLHQIDAVRYQENPEEVSLKELIAELFARSAYQQSMFGAEITVVEPDEDTTIVTARYDILRALVELTTNAIRYNKQQGKVFITTESTPENVIVHVQDTGYGIPPDQHHLLFQRFGRIVRPELPVHNGVGLGLYIAKALIERNNGHISFSTSEEVGSIFSVHLPRNQDNP